MRNIILSSKKLMTVTKPNRNQAYKIVQIFEKLLI